MGISWPCEQPKADGVKVGIEFIACNGNEDSIFDCKFHWMQDYYTRRGYPEHGDYPDYPYGSVDCLGMPGLNGRYPPNDDCSGSI